jgi:beta-phosphoglucomutase family hydrolase
MADFELKGAIFDLDGVITGTAESHFRAWKATFEEFLREKTGNEPEPFTYEDDYIPYVDGKPRYQGVKAFLESRDIELPYGDPKDEPGHDTICAVGNRKNDAFRETVERDGVDIYESTIEMVRALKDRGVQVGVASSSKNCSYVLRTTGLIDMFETVVDGLVSAELGLSGKPDPDIFVVAAERMGLTPKQCMMVEDAYSGVEAGRNGNFAFVLGVCREGGPEGLYAHGADIVVYDLGEIDLARIDRWFDEGLSEDGRQLEYRGFEPGEERLREALTTVGNGYIGSRGAFCGRGIFDDVHYPGTYMSGLFNRLGTEVHGRTVYNNDFVNLPNWLPVEVFHQGAEEPLHPQSATVAFWRHKLDFETAVTSRVMEFEDEIGRRTRIETRRFASMAEAHLLALEVKVTPLNHSGSIRLRSYLDGDIVNYGVERYRELANKHLDTIETQADGARLRLAARTNASKITVTLDATHRLTTEDPSHPAEPAASRSDTRATTEYAVELGEGRTARLEKLVWYASDRAWDIEGDEMPELESLSFEGLLADHRAAWARRWERADYRVRGDRFAQRTIRLHIYHLLTTASEHYIRMDTGFPARGLHGEAYRGHIFWDELFVAPFFNQNFPSITRAHLLYRYRRLDEARENAADAGYRGAMYPWQSADSGYRESQMLHYNPKSGGWDPDLSRRQRHISIAIAYNVWEYFYHTGDEGFMEDYGSEMLLEIARFWSSIAQRDELDGKYHIEGVMGPDEFHEKYPEADPEQGGLRDNAYTNVMACWIMHKVAETYQNMEEAAKRRLREKISFDDGEIDTWYEQIANMALPIDEDGLMSQFEGYMDLAELDWDHYRERYGNIRRMDRILKAEGDSPDRYKVAKQADVLMIWYLLSPGQVEHILEMMGQKKRDPTELLQTNYDYYIRRTSHGSTLSYVVHAAILNYLHGHEKDTRHWFAEALRSDIHDTQGGTTLEGIHCGVMAGTLEIILKNFAGVNFFRDSVEANPALPDDWDSVEFSVRFRGREYRFRVGVDQFDLAMDIVGEVVDGEAVRVKVYDREKAPEERNLEKDSPVSISYTPPVSRPRASFQ